MFVRDVTKCPHCGNSQIFDVYLDDSDSFERFGLLRAECYECLSFWGQTWHLDALRSVLLAATSSLPLRDSRRRCWRWSTSYRNGKVQRSAVLQLFRDVYPCGVVDWNFAELSGLLYLCREIRKTPGDTIYQYSPDRAISMRLAGL